jgi:hypothetical protein
VGIGASFVGVALIALGEREGVHFDWGALLILLAAVSTSLYFVLQKRYLATYGALQLAAYSIWAGTLLMLVFSPGLIHQVRTSPIEATLAVVYLHLSCGTGLRGLDVRALTAAGLDSRELSLHLSRVGHTDRLGLAAGNADLAFSGRRGSRALGRRAREYTG